MANITPYNPLTLEGVDESEAGQQRFLFVQGLEGTVVSEPDSLSNSVLVEDSDGNIQRALAVVPISSIDTSSVQSVNGQVGVATVNGSNTNATVGGVNDTIEVHLNTIKNDVGDLGDGLTDLRNDSVLKGRTTLQEINSPVSVKDEFTISDGIGNAIQTSIVNGVVTIATNNGLDIVSETNFDSNPTVVGDVDFDLMTNGQLVTKSQVQSVISDITGTHFEKWIASGKPEDLTLTTTLQKLYIPATTRFPNVPPSDIEPTEDGTGIRFKKAGIVHIKRNVSLGGSNTENLYYEARINDERLEPLLMQSVSVSENTMNFSIEFYWQVSENQVFSIWANCLKDDCVLNYKGVTTVVEYL